MCLNKTEAVKNRGIKIIGTGSCVPPFSVTNDDLAKFLDTSNEWIFSRTGIKTRHYSNGTMNYEMASEAARNALENAALSALDIDYIIVSTCTPDYLYPITACLVQKEIGAENAACIDINAACTGFVKGLEMARALLNGGGYDKILLVASENLTPQVDFTDRTSCILFGDGAGAVVLERGDKIFASHMKAKGVKAENPVLFYKIGYECNSPFTQTNDIERPSDYLQMDGKEVYKFAVEAMPEAAKAACEKSGLAVDEIDLFIPHQANIRIVQTAAKSLGVSMDKIYMNIETRGNTSSACMPTCLDELNKAGRLKEGMKLCFVGFGAGLTYGAVVLEL